MDSRIARELKLRYHPVAVRFTDRKPEGATQFVEGKWGCVAAMHVAAAKGRTVVFDRKTYGCPGGGAALGFGRRFAADHTDMAEFLSTGSPEREGEHYWKSPEEARAFIGALPYVDIPETYVVFEPLEKVDPAVEEPRLVDMYVDADQVSALVVLANYGRKTTDNVIVRMGAGCHTVCLIPLDEGRRDPPRAVIGMVDITARSSIDRDLLSFSMPFAMFREMEANVPGSFLEMADWKKVHARIPDPRENR